MKIFSKVAVAVTMAGSLAMVSAPAQASTVLDFARSAGGGGTLLTWDRDDSDMIGGTLTGASSAVILTFLSNALTNNAAETAIATNFSINASDPTFATLEGSGSQTKTIQWNLSGNFQFLAKFGGVYNGNAYAAGANLLTANFTNGTIGGRGNSGALNGFEDVISGSIVSYTSSVLNPVTLAQFRDNNFSFGLTANPGFSAAGCTTAGVDCTTSLADFRSSATGLMAAAIPEPGTWALMIGGFAGAGAMLRRRRSVAATA